MHGYSANCANDYVKSRDSSFFLEKTEFVNSGELLDDSKGGHTRPPSHICLISRPTMAAILDVADRLPARKTESCGVAN